MVAHRILVPGGSGSSPDEAAHRVRCAVVAQCRKSVRLKSGRSQVRLLSAARAPFGYGLVSCPFKAVERVRVPHGVPMSGSSVVESAALIRRRSEVQILLGQHVFAHLGHVAQSARAPACRAEGHGFKSRHGRWGISSVGKSACLASRRQGFDSPILHSTWRRGRKVMQLGANEPPRDTRLGVRLPPPPRDCSQCAAHSLHGGRGVTAT
jgi:hypothetical protein